MNKEKLASIAESIMLCSEDADGHADGAKRIVANIIRIEEFIEEADAEEWEADDIGHVVLSDPKENGEKSPQDEKKRMISASQRSDGGYVVIPRVV